MNEQPEANAPTINLSLINRTSVKKYALEVSKQRRAGKFTRVSAEFLNDVEADLDSAIRSIVSPSDCPLVVPAPGTKFTTGKAAAKAANKLDVLAMKIVSSKVMRHPSLGCTLK